MNDKISQGADAQAKETARRTKEPVLAELQKPKGALDERALREAGEFTIIFHDDKGLTKCKLLAADNYNFVVESNGRRMLIPKHSIKYVTLPASSNLPTEKMTS